MSADVSEIPSCSAFELLAALIHTHYWRILTGDSCDLIRFPSRHRIYMTHDTCDIHTCIHPSMHATAIRLGVRGASI